MRDKVRSHVEIDTEEMIKWRSLSQEEIDQCWMNSADRKEEEVLDKFQVEDGKREAFKDRGAPLEWMRVRRNKIYRMRKCREDCWARVFSLFRRLQSKQEESTEEE